MPPKKKPFNHYIIDEDMVKIKLEKRSGEIFWTLIDLDDLEKVKALNLHWHVKWNQFTRSYYCAAGRYTYDESHNKKKETIHLHRIILPCAYSLQIPDHINHDTLDNRKSNLRLTEIDENSKSRSGKNSNNTSGYRNVSWVNKKWVVQLQVNGKNTMLGKFDDVHIAGHFAQTMRNKIYGEFAGKIKMYIY